MARPTNRNRFTVHIVLLNYRIAKPYRRRATVLAVKSRSFAPIQKVRANSDKMCGPEHGAIWPSANTIVFMHSPTFQLTKPLTQRRATVATNCMSFFIVSSPDSRRALRLVLFFTCAQTTIQSSASMSSWLGCHGTISSYAFLSCR